MQGRSLVEMAEHSLAVLGVVLFMGLLAPELLSRFRVPFTTAIILVGVLLGPHGLARIEVDSTLTLFAFLGATFHMLLAGFEAQSLDLRPFKRENLTFFVGGGVFPAAAGVGTALALDMPRIEAALVGSIFISSSMLLVFSFAEHLDFEDRSVSASLKSATVFWELASIFIAFVVLKSVDPHPRFSLWVLVGLVLASVIVLRLFVPEITRYVFAQFAAPVGTSSERRVRFSLALLLVALFVYAGLDVHPIVAAFLVGFALANADQAEVIREKLRLVGYALFIPVFFFVVGLEIDLNALGESDMRSLGVLAFVAAAVLTKLIGTSLASALLRFPARDCALFAIASTMKLAIPIVTAYTAMKAGVVRPVFFSATVTVAVVTSIVAPIVLELMRQKRGEDVP